MISLGGFDVDDVSSTIRIDSESLGLGTIIDLEDRLLVDRSASVGRLAGHYRFNRAHRIEWAQYTVDRDGSVVVADDDIQIGDTLFPINYRIDTDWNFSVSKIGYAWSFINTSRYEVFLGAGLNVQNLSATFRGTDVEGTIEERVYDGDGTLPLPTTTAGMRYNVNDRLAVNFRYEALYLEIGEDSGRLQDTLLSVDYQLFPHFGIGVGINNFNLDIKVNSDDDLRGELGSSYRGFLIFGTARF